MNDVEPLLLDRIAGQPQVVAALQMHLAAYWNDRQAGRNPAFGPVGLFGCPGGGKTLLAHALHSELGNTRLLECIGETLDAKECLYAMLMSLEDDNTTLFIDEAQGLSRPVQHLLLKVLAEGKLSVPSKFRKSDYQIQLPSFVTILASTHEYTLQPALLSRLRIYLRMMPYRVEDLAKILQQRADALRWRYSDASIFLEIARRSKKSPRLGLKLLQMGYNVARSQNEDVIIPEHIQQAFVLSDIDAQGLDSLEQSYLRILSETHNLPLNVLASRLGLPSRTIQEVVEPYLLQEGFLSKEGSLRMLTEKGEKHIQSSTC
jgi:Holliday junction DNA helicase RuvB